MEDGRELVQALESHEMGVVIDAVESVLAQRGGEPIDDLVQLLAARLSSADADVASLAAFALDLLSRKRPADGAASAVVAACRRPEASVRFQAWQALTGIVASMSRERYQDVVLPELATLDPAGAVGAVKAAAKRGFAIGPALPGLVALLEAEGDLSDAAFVLPVAGAAGCDLRPVYADLRKLVGARKRVGNMLAEGLAWAALAPARWDELDWLLEHPAPEVRRAARAVADTLLERRKEAARAGGDTGALKELFLIRRRLNR